MCGDQCYADTQRQVLIFNIFFSFFFFSKLGPWRLCQLVATSDSEGTFERRNQSIQEEEKFCLIDSRRRVKPQTKLIIPTLMSRAPNGDSQRTLSTINNSGIINNKK